MAAPPACLQWRRLLELGAGGHAESDVRRQMVARHQRHRLAREDAHAVHLAAIGQHLRKAQVVGRGRDHAAASDPKTTGIMQGFPPSANKTVRIADGSGWKFPQIRWAFSHTRELGPTVNVWRGSGRPTALVMAERKDLDNVAFTT